MEQDDREGLVAEYLSMLLPDGWEKMDLYERRAYIRDPNDPTQPQGQYERKEVTNIEIWCECFGKPKEDMKPHDSYAISAIMTRLSGWTRTEIRRRIPIYGMQRIYKKL